MVSSRRSSLEPSLIVISEGRKRLDVSKEQVADPEPRASDRDICDIEDRPIRQLDEIHDMAMEELRFSEDPIGEIA
jgi:hypothetical protein